MVYDHLDNRGENVIMQLVVIDNMSILITDWEQNSTGAK